MLYNTLVRCFLSLCDLIKIYVCQYDGDGYHDQKQYDPDRLNHCLDPFRLLHAQQASPLHKTTPRNMGPDSRLAQRQAVPESDCLWHSCIGHKRCHISLAMSHQRLRRSPIPLHCRRLNQYQRQLPRLSPHVLPLIQVQHLPERPVRCQRQRYQLQRHSLPGRGTGTLSLAERKSGSTDRLPGMTHKTCAGRAWLRTMGWPDRYRRIPHT